MTERFPRNTSQPSPESRPKGPPTVDDAFLLRQEVRRWKFKAKTAEALLHLERAGRENDRVLRDLDWVYQPWWRRLLGRRPD